MTLRTAVVGAGYFGRFHARKLARLPGSRLVAVVDVDRARAAEAAPEADALEDFRELAGRVDAVSIAAPTTQHHAIASWLLDRGIHVFVEKPIAAGVEEGRDLVARAAAAGRVLQVGHIQRVLVARLGLAGCGIAPTLLEAVRIAPYRARATDVGVVLDLMIHDIDLALALIGGTVAEVSATGGRVVSQSEDYAAAALVFADGRRACLTAARVGAAIERRLRLFGPEGHAEADLQARTASIVLGGAGAMAAPRLVEAGPGDDLETELAEFLACVRDGRRPAVDGAAGTEALRVALAAMACLERGRPVPLL